MTPDPGPLEPPPARVTIVPTLRYRDARAAIRFLCEAFGFEERLVVPGEDGAVLHSQLAFGNGLVMVGSDRDDEYGRFVRAPEEGRPGTQAPYVIVADAEASFERARSAGAHIVRGLVAEPHGGRSFACQDPEGHLWSFGEYDPFDPPPAAGA